MPSGHSPLPQELSPQMLQAFSQLGALRCSSIAQLLPELS